MVSDEDTCVSRPTTLSASVSPSLGLRALPDPLTPAVVDELVERSSLPPRLRHRVEGRTEGALELFLRPLRHDLFSAKVRKKEATADERAAAEGAGARAERNGGIGNLRRLVCLT